MGRLNSRTKLPAFFFLPHACRGRPPIFCTQLFRDACWQWVLAVEECNGEVVIDHMVLEQFTTRLPRGTVEWVQCHRPVSLDVAVQLADDHMAMGREGVRGN
ncbi:zinc finger and SCAN domain-containing protein 23-like [Myxocyprinus asiaticus]|uniref:zinc finger and SCAN domain-containing protein 23-like n=1 Tax=Myxocyprinus asiaticus TaxID=70543 RepID=UPI0022213050|nr:zinc finger and SCAN domain-containing protein 23-like [Myxocyprinus asiaticus]